MAASAEGSSSKTTVSHNVLSLAHTLLLSSVPPATHLNHPYAPSTLYGSWKGKAREGSQGVGLDEQERMLKMLKEGLEAGKAVVQEAAKGDRSTKLARAMRDV
ncbi:hypothetical protein EON65_46300 [archaeon]|nr:MAG: hypothetical protein EON65_46300 [archaeon]